MRDNALRPVSERLSTGGYTSMTDVLVAGVLWGSPSVLAIPEYDRNIRQHSLGVVRDWNTAEDLRIAYEMDILKDVYRVPGHRIDWANSPVHHFMRLYNWGGDDLIHYGQVMDRLVLDTKRNPRLVSLLSSDWRMELPLDADELGFITTVSGDNGLWRYGSVDECVHVIRRDRAWLARWSDNHIVRTSQGTAGEFIKRIRGIVTDSSALAWYLTLSEWCDANNLYESDTLFDEVAALAGMFPFDVAAPYISRGIRNPVIIRAAMHGAEIDGEMVIAMQGGGI